MTNPHLKRVVEWIDLFMAGNLTLTQLWMNLGLIPSLLESSVPLHVREGIQDCANKLELIDETKDAANARKIAEGLASSLRNLISGTG